jgi:hypothetical protein
VRAEDTLGRLGVPDISIGCPEDRPTRFGELHPPTKKAVVAGGAVAMKAIHSEHPRSEFLSYISEFGESHLI